MPLVFFALGLESCRIESVICAVFVSFFGSAYVAALVVIDFLCERTIENLSFTHEYVYLYQ